MKFIVLRPDGSYESKDGDLDISEVSNLLGGQPEQVPSPPELAVFAKVPDTVASTDMFNWSATRLVQHFLMPTDRVFGPAIVAGKPDVMGTPSDIPESTLRTLDEWYEHRTA